MVLALSACMPMCAHVCVLYGCMCRACGVCVLSAACMCAVFWVNVAVAVAGPVVVCVLVCTCVCRVLFHVFWVLASSMNLLCLCFC